MIRKYKSEDCREIADLFFQTVHSVNAKDYTKKQLDAWADGDVDLAEWNKSMSEHYTVVCAVDDKIVGFGDIDETGYLDRLYVHKDYQRLGIASHICDELERAAVSGTITTHASITAKPFFEQRGYRAIKEQQISRQGIRLTNFIMEKGVNSELSSPPSPHLRISSCNTP